MMMGAGPATVADGGRAAGPGKANVLYLNPALQEEADHNLLAGELMDRTL